MKKRTRSTPSWLLTVASAYSLLPGCADEVSEATTDSAVLHADGGAVDAGLIAPGITIAPANDAGRPWNPYADGGHPPGVAPVPPYDAGADAATDAGVDAACGATDSGLVYPGIIVVSHDGGCAIPIVGAVIRPPDAGHS